MVKKAFHILQPVARSKTQGDRHVKYVNSLQNIVQCIKKSPVKRVCQISFVLGPNDLTMDNPYCLLCFSRAVETTPLAPLC